MAALPENMSVAIDELESAIADIESRLESARAERDEAKGRQVELEIENANLRRELSLVRERQSASAGILSAIANLSGDADQLLQLIAETTARLFGAPGVTISIAAGDEWIKRIHFGASSQRSRDESPAVQRRPSGDTLSAAVYRNNQQIHIPDLDNIDPAMAHWPIVAARAEGTRSIAGTPLRNDGKAVGAMLVFRDRPVPFTDEELALQQSFADQAVIAIENARLFNETRESLERQTVTADILKVIAGSPSDVQPVFEAIVDSAAKLFEPCSATITTLKDDKLHWNATAASITGFDVDRARSAYPMPFDPNRAPSARAILERRIIEIPDVTAPDTPEYTRSAAAAGGFRSVTFVPLVDQERGIGTIIFTHPQIGFRFSEWQLKLIQTFADQAVIAIQNARLFDETREALDRQTATADILKVIAASPSDVRPVFEAIASSAKRLLGGFTATVLHFRDDQLHLVAFTPTNPEADQGLQGSFPQPVEKFPIFGMVRDGATIQFPDIEADNVPAMNRDLGRLRGFRSVLFVPLMNQRRAVGILSVTRTEPGAFADHHVQLLQTFADQAVIAIENTRLFNETKEALERQTATAEILKVIASSPSDVQPVFDAIAANANRLVGGFSTAVHRMIDDIDHLVAFTPTNPASDAILKAAFPRHRSEVPAIAWGVNNGETAQIADCETADPRVRELGRARGWRSVTYTPLMNKDAFIGFIACTRREPGLLADHHVQLLRTFADQAVIAIENARLFNETKEALERQTATAEILRVIASSPSDVQPVFDVIVANAKRLIGGFSAAIWRFADDAVQLAAFTPTDAAGDEALKASFPVPIASFPPYELIRNGAPAELPDTELEPAAQDIARARGFRSMLFAPLMNDGTAIGVMTVTRTVTGPFGEQHSRLLQMFADQAVIAIKNVGLFNEVKARTEDLSEALRQQTATADVLKLISRSAFDLESVLNTLTESAARLCNADMGAIALRDERGFYHATNYNFPVDWVKITDTIRLQPDRSSVIGRTLLAQAAVQIDDVLADPDYKFPDMQQAAGYRSLLGVPMMRGGEPIGVLFLGRKTVAPYTDRQVELVSTFADQAVIAIENVRLFDEVQARTVELSESLQQQTAVGDVLKTISRSTFDLQPVLDTLVNTAAILCGADMAFIMRRVGDEYRAGAAVGYTESYIDFLRTHPLPVNRGTVTGRAVLERRPVQILDVVADPEYTLVETTALAGQRTTLGVPLLREEEPIGVIVLARQRVEAFTQKQIELVATFADQAVIAIENVRLFDELRQRTVDLTDSLEQQTATSEVLRVISSSAGDLAPVFDTMLRKAMELCGANFGVLNTFDGTQFETAATYGLPPAYDEYRRSQPLRYGPGTAPALLLEGEAHVELVDLPASEAYRAGEPNRRALVDLGGAHCLLAVPLLKDTRVVGNVMIFRQENRRFSEKQITLLKQFAAQAVIAIENTRLLNELRQRTEDLQARTRDLSEALTYQTGSSNILRVIASSPTDVGPVLQAIVESACELCDAYDALVRLKDGDGLAFGAHHGPLPVSLDSVPISPDSTGGRAVIERKPVHVHDLLSSEGDSFSYAQGLARLHGERTILSVPLLRENESVGAIVLRRLEVNPFTDKQIALLQTFADQAVIAIGNVRLFEEVQARTRELSEALTYQTGSSNILRVIASSPTDVKPVLQAIVESACELCEAYDAVGVLKDGEHLRFGAHHGPIPMNIEKWPINRRWTAGRAFIDKMPVHVHDLLAEGDEFPDGRELSQRMGHRTILSVPLLRENESIGSLVLRRTEVKPFTDKQIALLQTFADQAVIAIGNVRLFEEVQQRTRELSESLQFQTASSEVLKVISRSPDTLQPVLDAIVQTSRELCGSDASTIFLLRDGKFHVTAVAGDVPPHLEYLKANPQAVDQPGSVLARMARLKHTVHVPNVADDPEFSEGVVGIGGPRALLVSPLMQDGEVVGAIVLRQSFNKPFTERQIEAIEVFADQAVIAISNVNLFEQVQERTRELSKSLDDLRTAQDRLVQTEKLASLGQLTAGIAHEIKNPLNFVNNFAALSTELTDELNEVLKPSGLTEKVRIEVDELTSLLKNNLEKVVQHGKRADSIIKNMLLHSREGSGEHRPTDINTLVDESLNLAYHGARAEKPDFNIALERDLDATAGEVDLFPQEITRVLLNLISNGFYAVTKRRKEGGEPGFEPTLRASTKSLGEIVEIRIRDNGIGIPPEVKEKMFNPFFTTKPAGEGTGLGLSMSHDIIVKQHGGTIDVYTEQGHFTEFRIVLPRASNFADKSRG